MKSQLKKIAQFILKRCAIRILNKFHPDVIAVTGSIGKTSTKDAIYEVLAPKLEVRKNTGNFNNEIGVPLTIIGVDSSKKIFWIIYKTFFAKKYPQILVLEMGADRLGDMRYLTSFIKPKISVVTRVASSHLEYLGSLRGVAKEKGVLVEVLDRDGWAILNGDDENVREMSERTGANVLFYGTGRGCDLKASDIKMDFDGLDFKISYKKESAKVHMDIVGRHMVYSALAGAAVGLVYGMNLKEIAKNLGNYKAPKNRVNILKGIKKTTIISDIYNANPESVAAALDVLEELAGSKRRVAMLGDMFELGGQSRELHLGLSDRIKRIADVAVLTGVAMKDVFEQLSPSLKEKVFWYDDSAATAKAIGEIIREGDIILIKGSRGMKMEKILDKIK